MAMTVPVRNQQPPSNENQFIPRKLLNLIGYEMSMSAATCLQVYDMVFPKSEME